jgi:tetratricopeptide (TPR) repeat protein
MRAWCNGLLGHTQQAIEEASRSSAEAEEAHDVFTFCNSQRVLGECLLAAGDVEGAIHHLETARGLIEAYQLLSDYQLWTYPSLARAYLERLRGNPAWSPAERRGQLRRISGTVRVALRIARKRVNRRAAALQCKAALERERGNRRRAARYLARAFETARTLGARMQLADAHQEEGRWRLEDGDVERARESLQRALALYQECEAAPFVSRVRRLLDG